MTIYISVNYDPGVAGSTDSRTTAPTSTGSRTAGTRTADTRTRLLDAGADLFRRQGYAATGLKRIVEEGDAPWGSLYHFFPGGKEQLGADAVTRAGEGYRRLIESVLDDDDPVASARALFRLGADALEASGFRDGCPVATVALEAASTNEGLRAACAAVFVSWVEVLESHLVRSGVERRRATALAWSGLAAFEGAIVLSRTLRTTAPLTAAAEHVADALSEAVDAPARRAGSGR